MTERTGRFVVQVIVVPLDDKNALLEVRSQQGELLQLSIIDSPMMTEDD